MIFIFGILIYSASLLKENNIFYIIASNNEGGKLSQPLKVYDFNGNKVKEINRIKKKYKLFGYIL